MRVVGGRLRGRNLAAPKSQAIRPTADRLRESLFNILVHAYDDPITGTRVLDLFAGTGALGIEAMSRGASFTLFIDDGAEARGSERPASKRPTAKGDSSRDAAARFKGPDRRPRRDDDRKPPRHHPNKRKH